MNQPHPNLDPALARYSRQILFEAIGLDGQQRLQNARAVLFGCGALGTVLANTLVRAGLGFLRICDRDFIELDNLQRQVLFDEDDIAAQRPKAVAAAEKLRRINAAVTVEPHVLDVNHTNIERLAQGAQILLDGTDNFETRFLINDLSIKSGRPWIYGAVIGATGLMMPILPGETPCLRCVFEEAPPPEMNPTCDTAGVIGPAVNVVASLQAAEALKLLCGKKADILRGLLHLDLWTGRFMTMNVQSARDRGTCPCCHQREFTWLDGRNAAAAVTLCGRNAVQINPQRCETNSPAGQHSSGAGVSAGQPPAIDFAAIARKLEPVATGPVTFNRFLLRATIDGCELTLFPDARAIIKGTTSPEKARSLYAKYIGQ